MRLTTALSGPPVFHYWKHFGAGKKRRIPYYKYWWNRWRKDCLREEVKDYTIAAHELPAGARIMDAEDFLIGPLSAMPDEILDLKHTKLVHDHPWPFNVTIDPVKSQPLRYCYRNDTRFFVPRDDSLVLTNTILETDSMKANPALEPTDEHLEMVKRQYDWAVEGDSILVPLPRKRIWPFVNKKPMRTFGITKERKELNVLSSIQDIAHNLVAQHYNKQKVTDKVEDILGLRSIMLPKCNVPLERHDSVLNLDLCIDSMSIGRRPLPLINDSPESTRDKTALSIHPRSWRSLLEQDRNYSPDSSFTLPQNSYLHTILVSSRIKIDYRNSDEMLARLLVHAFGLAAQYTKFKNYERIQEGDQTSVVMENALFSKNKDLKVDPIMVQAIGFDHTMNQFHFLKYQLNTVDFNDVDESRLKNQAWYSGPVESLTDALRYFICFVS